MAFVNERISDEDRKKHGIDSKYSYWTADHKQEVFLLSDGVDKECHARFVLLQNGEAIKFGGKQKGAGSPEEGILIYYFIEQLQTPVSQKEKKEQTLLLIKDALKEFQLTCRKLENSTVTVEFKENI